MNNYEQYAVIDAQIKALENQKEELRNDILNDMKEKGEEAVETGVGKFTVARRKTWVYPEKVTDLGDKFKAAKAKAESTGEATFTEEESLRFTQIKL